LHKTGVSAEKMLIHALRRAQELTLAGEDLEMPRHLTWFFNWKPDDETDPAEMLAHFSRLDDHDVTAAIKYWSEARDFTLAFLSKGLLDRKLFRLEWHNEPIAPEYAESIRQKVVANMGEHAILEHLVYTGSESNRAYDDSREQIKILFKNGSVLPIDQCSDVPLYTQLVTKHFICYPKNLP
ncbi:MAG: phosphohydrolase, partial [Saprospiraceae bacterium]|nr:phosphohydrolase [Saprospiraceae bacterium]